MSASGRPGGAPRARRRRLARIVTCLEVYVVLGGLVSLLGWVLDRQRWTDWEVIGISIQPYSTVAVTGAGVALTTRDEVATKNGKRPRSARPNSTPDRSIASSSATRIQNGRITSAAATAKLVLAPTTSLWKRSGAMRPAAAGFPTI